MCHPKSRYLAIQPELFTHKKYMQKQNSLTQLGQLLAKMQRHENNQSKILDRLKKASCIYLLAPTSFLGTSFTVPLAERLTAMGKAVVLVDDTLSTAPSAISHCTVIRTINFSQLRSSEAVAINMANTVFAYGFFNTIAKNSNTTCIDIIPVIDAFNLPVIYQSAQTMRTATLQRIDDYMALASQLDDALSIQTLGACLEMRITMDRNSVIPVLCSLEDEYFSPYAAGKDVTFALGEKEIFCDIGAHIGMTIRKFLTATKWSYSAIHAFEPDKANYAALQQGFFQNLPNFDAKNIALSDSKKTLNFSETGTMGSRLDGSGNVKVQTSTLDDEVEHATFIKMDVEGHEVSILRGAQRLISLSKPKLAITGYHFADDLLDIAKFIKEIDPRYRLRLRQHSFYYYDTILYADIKND